jgi:hypothetical protein
MQRIELYLHSKQWLTSNAGSEATKILTYKKVLFLGDLMQAKF